MDIDEKVSLAAQWVRQRWARDEDDADCYGVILGTGSGGVAASIREDSVFDYGEIPGFPTATALGHVGQLVCGHLEGRPVVAFRGRFHPYEGHPLSRVTFPVDLMAALGVQKILITNASGGINPRFRSGELMAIDSHLDLMLRGSSMTVGKIAGKSTLIAYDERPAAMRADDAYRDELIAVAQACGRRNDFVVHRGTYAGLLGPNYETRAEYRMLRRVGADVAGMSTIHEATAAARYQIPILALSVISNVAKPDALQATSGQEVIEAAAVASQNILKIAKAIF